MDVNDYVINCRLKIIVKPNSSTNEIIGFDEDKKALRVNIKAAPEKGEANKEVIKFFRKLLKKEVRIKSGFIGKEKVLEIR